MLDSTTTAKAHMSGQSERPRTLIFSQRNLSKILPFRCAHFEFEDVISQVDSVDIMAPRIDPSTRRHSLAKQIAYHTSLVFNPGIEHTPIRAGYDLFMAICGNPSDLLRIDAVDWRNHCKKAICLIDEVWVKELRDYRKFLLMLRKFDLVVLYYSKSVDPINELIGERKCVFLPPGVDTIRFCASPGFPERSIDVYSMGRRSAITHAAFMEMAADDGLFYLYDSTSADQVLNPMEHRVLFANISKRSRYFIANPGLIDRPDIRGTQIEIGNRYFEAAAAGAILLGERPNNGEFEKFFDWPDALIELPYNSSNAYLVVKELDKEPDRQSAARQANMCQALLRHDWVYRWEAILKRVGVLPLPQLEARKTHLRSLADEVSQEKSRQKLLSVR
jgi:Glycosyl transferases group 1